MKWYLLGALVVLIISLESEIGSAYIKGLTGRTPVEWAEKLASYMNLWR